MDTVCRLQKTNTVKVRQTDVAVMYFREFDYDSGTSTDIPPMSIFVNILEKGFDRIVLRTTERLIPRTVFFVKTFDSEKDQWELLCLEACKLYADPARSNNYILEAKILRPDHSNPHEDPEHWHGRIGPGVTDYRFFRGTPLIYSLPPEAVCPLLNSLILKRIRAGERFIRQGDPGDAVYLIQDGICAAIVENDGKSTTVARLRKGDLVGEMALLTGEKRSAHVEAETDMRIWMLGKKRFEDLAGKHPELRIFLTNLMTNWINTRTITARRKIGKYIITHIVGSGAYSIVYKGLHEVLNMPVAIKMMKHDMAMDRDFLINFHEEARTIAQFNHENIVKVHDIEKRYRTMFIIMEYLEGCSLRSELNSLLRLTSRQVVTYLLQLCRGLHYAHQRGVVHQDIKPDNIFLLLNGKAKILDFGLACRCGTEGRFCGTPFYMSPEQIECLQVDERTDIYALGIMAYELLAGRRPYPEDDMNRLLELHVKEDIPDPADVIPGIPEALRNFILKACERDVNRRYREIPEVLKDLQPLAAWLGLTHQ